MELIDYQPGGYRFLRGIAPYSSGVVAMDGFEIVRVRLRKPIPLHESAFDLIARYLSDLDRPLHSLCAMELRIPVPLSFEGFRKFNHSYQEMLAAHALLFRGDNPIARTNIAPRHFALQQPSIFAFSHTSSLADKSQYPSFIVAGAGDLTDQSNLSSDAIVRPKESTIDALKEKATVVMEVMQARLSGLKVSWDDISSVCIYTMTPLHLYLVDTVLERISSAALGGVQWFYSNPPIKGLDYEMDMRGIQREVVCNLE